MITAGLVDGSQTPGIYRVLEPVSTISVGADRRGVGQPRWCRRRSTTGEFYRGLAEAMGWPGYFGANLDALWDGLTDLSRPTAVILERWTDVRPGPARRAGTSILAVFAERCQIDPAVRRRARLTG